MKYEVEYEREPEGVIKEKVDYSGLLELLEDIHFSKGAIKLKKISAENETSR